MEYDSKNDDQNSDDLQKDDVQADDLQDDLSEEASEDLEAEIDIDEDIGVDDDEVDPVPTNIEPDELATKRRELEEVLDKKRLEKEIDYLEDEHFAEDIPEEENEETD